MVSGFNVLKPSKLKKTNFQVNQIAANVLMKNAASPDRVNQSKERP